VIVKVMYVVTLDEMIKKAHSGKLAPEL